MRLVDIKKKLGTTSLLHKYCLHTNVSANDKTFRIDLKQSINADIIYYLHFVYATYIYGTEIACEDAIT